MQPQCLNQFSYSWFPQVDSPDQSNWQSGTFISPGSASSSQMFFRLPTLDITKRSCTPSPFVQGTIYTNGATRSATALWNTAGIVPTQCSNDLTQTIVSLIGPGYYSINPGNGSFANLTMAADNDTITCSYTWGPNAPPGLQVTSVNITVGDGPVFATDNPLYTGNTQSPAWQYNDFNVYGQSPASISLQAALHVSTARNYTRIIGCLVTAIDPATTFPIYLEAQTMVVEQWNQPWIPYNYPMPGNYTPSNPVISS